MKLTVRFLLLLFPILAVVALGFNSLMEKLEYKWAIRELDSRAKLIYHTIHDPVTERVTSGKLKALHRIYQRIQKDPNLLGLLICSVDGKIISRSHSYIRGIKCDIKAIQTLLKLSSEKKIYFQSHVIFLKKQKAHQSLFALVDDKDQKTHAFLFIFHQLHFLTQKGALTRKYTFYAFICLAILISILTILVYRWSMSEPIKQLTHLVTGVLSGDSEKVSSSLDKLDFFPFAKDLDELFIQLRGAQKKTKQKNTNVKKELSLKEKSQEDLKKEMKLLFPEAKLSIIAEPEPLIHEKRGQNTIAIRPVSGTLSVAEPLMLTNSGLWIAHGRGSADKENVDPNGMCLIPPHNSRYVLKRVWLSKEEEERFFYSFSKQGLWPLCHIAHERPVFQNKDWEAYVDANTKFASTFYEEMKSSRPIVMVHDYSFALVPSMIRKLRPDALILLFWHIPWPSVETARICPWIREILTGMLGAHVIGFQLQYHCNQFLDCVDRYLEARVSRDEFSVTYQDHTSYIRALPVGIDFPDPVPKEHFPEIRKKIFEELSIPSHVQLFLGVDRLDYTKGLLERLKAFELLLTHHPKMVGKVMFLQIAAPVRLHLKRYQQLQAELQQIADRINWKFYSQHCPPVQLRIESFSKERLYDFYRATDVLVVSALHDGMNLVSKEFVACREDEQGTLVLSTFTGASLELKDALLINPYSLEDFSETLFQTLSISKEEQKRRMQKLRQTVLSQHVYRWNIKLLRALHEAGRKEHSIITPQKS